MDTSEQYIKMRVAAIPDLGMGTPPLKLTRFYTELVWVDAKADWYYSDGGEATQLERQDQLQDMLLSSIYCRKPGVCSGLCLMLDHFSYYVETEHTDCFDPREELELSRKSMEQIWLGFAMKEKHKKVWNEKGWIIGG